MDNKARLANLLFYLVRFIKIHKDDLTFLINYFSENEQYERCSVVRELIELGFYHTDSPSCAKGLATIEKAYDFIDSSIKRIKKTQAELQIDDDSHERLLQFRENHKNDIDQIKQELDKELKEFEDKLAEVNDMADKFWEYVAEGEKNINKGAMSLDIPFKNPNNKKYLNDI